MDSKYYVIKKKYLACALSYLGFHYYKFDDPIHKCVVYSFDNTVQFQEAIGTLIQLKNKYR